MRKHPITLQSFMIVGSFGAWLLGCPVWSEQDNGPVAFPTTDGGTTDNPPVVVDNGPAACTAHRDCASGFCDATGRCAVSTSCSSTATCPSGSYCETSRGTCVPGCTATADCTRLAAGLVCDTAARRCVPGGTCTTDAQCAATPATPACLGGTCQPTANQCQFNYQCTGSGQSCVDGQCIVGCTSANVATACAAGQVCTSGRCAYPTAADCGGRCTSAQLCVSGACLATCTVDTQCGMGQRCDGGVCRVDTRPRPFCTTDAQCNPGVSVCNNGACRLLCPLGPGMAGNNQCMMFDVQFDLCLADAMSRSLCSSTNEQRPECARSATCSAGRTCVNARCQ